MKRKKKGVGRKAKEKSRRQTSAVSGYVRDEGVQACELTDMLSILDRAGVEGTFVFTFVSPANPYNDNPSFDFDTNSFSLSVQNGPAEIFRNVTENGNHWLEIQTVGRKSNRDGIGTKIRLESASGPQYNHVTTSVGYASSSDPRVHFGLGKDDRVKGLTLEWPSGIRQELTDVRADQILKVVEPAQ